MRKFLLVVELVVCLCLTGCTSYEDYSMAVPDEESTKKTEVQIPMDMISLPDDIVYIEDYQKEGIIQGINGQLLNVKIKKAVVSDDMAAYRELGDNDNIEEWLNRVSERNGFNSRYDSSSKKFISGYDGINMKIFMVKAELVNHSDEDVGININNIHLYNVNRTDKTCSRLSIYESVFHDQSESTGSDRGNINIAAGEHRDIVVFFVEPEKIIRSYENDSGKLKAVLTEEYSYDNIYIRLSSRGNSKVKSSENFAKVITGQADI